MQRLDSEALTMFCLCWQFGLVGGDTCLALPC